jgi:Tol biopolymer transport system component
MRSFLQLSIGPALLVACLTIYADASNAAGSGKLSSTNPAQPSSSNATKKADKGLAPGTWVRLDSGLSHITPNVNAKFIAYVPDKKLGIRILNMETGSILEPSGHFIGPSFFWSPDGMRLFYRELLSKSGRTESRIRAWDVALGKNIDVDSFGGPSGFLSFDPRDNRMLLMHKTGIKSKKLVFPNNRLAFWQSGERKDLGKWVMAQKGVTFVTDAGFAMQKLPDDNSGIESFDISPDGTTAAWATRSGKLYVSTHGETPKFLDFGRDPKWHPERPLLVYAGGRMVGNKAADYDIKITAPDSKGSFLTATQHIAERWPAWSPDGKTIFFTLKDSQELRSMSFPQQGHLAKRDGQEDRSSNAGAPAISSKNSRSLDDKL